MHTYRLVDRLKIMREMRAHPAVVADELHELRAMRDRAQLVHDQVSAESGAFGQGMRTAAKVALGLVPDFRAWLAPLTPDGIRE